MLLILLLWPAAMATHSATVSATGHGCYSLLLLLALLLLLPMLLALLLLALLLLALLMCYLLSYFGYFLCCFGYSLCSLLCYF
jgi:hypothetical protein